MFGILDFNKRIITKSGSFSTTALAERLEGGVVLFQEKEEAQRYIEINDMSAIIVQDVHQNTDGTCSYTYCQRE